MKRWLLLSTTVGLGLAFAADPASAIEQPEAASIIQKDLLKPAKVYTMPKGCITDDKDAIARGKYIFNNLNGNAAKGTPPKGLAKKNPDGSPKQYGNCVACHNIEGASGAGNIGPDLTNYYANYMKSGARNDAFVYQKIADARIDNPDTHMTINLTTGLFTPREICDLTSYVIAVKH
jgi:L-cysteine S-thiosulfotransferase